MIEDGKFLQQRYRIQKQIGQGGMGAVYVATDERFGSTVAIKQTLCMDDNYRKAIEREARLLNSLRHNALPRVSDHFVEDDGQFLVMEFIPGEDLYCILEETGKPFDSETVIGWADQLLDALNFLHNQSDPVIHRDIKPQNLKLTAKGQIILLDFGLAKGNPTESNNKTAAKSIFGYSRNYASLEQIQGTGTDPRSDLYSLAATLYHLVTGIAPEDALTRAMAVLSNRPDPLVPAHLVNDQVPRGFSAILCNALDLNAGNRPATATEMRAMIAEHERYAGMALDVRPTNEAYDGALFTQKTKLMPAATVQAEQHTTEAKTAIMTDDDSRLTAVRFAKIDTGPAPPPTTRRFAFAAVGLGSLLMVGAVGGAVMFYEPEYVEPVSVAEPAPAAEPVVEPEAPAVVELNSAEQVAVSDAAPSANSARSASQPQPRSAEIARQPEAPVAPTRREIQTPEGKIIIEGDGEKITMGEMRIEGNKVITPQGVFVLKEPPIPPDTFRRDFEKNFPANKMQQLSPQERRALIRTFQRYNVNTAARPPVPPKPEP